MSLPNQSNSFVLPVVRDKHYILGNYCCLERELISLGKKESEVKEQDKFLLSTPNSMYACRNEFMDGKMSICREMSELMDGEMCVCVEGCVYE